VNEEVIVLSQVLAHNANIGYETYKNLHLKSLNGVPVKNLKHLKSLIDSIAKSSGEDVSGSGGSGSAEGKAKKASTKKGAKGRGAGANMMVFEFSNGQMVVIDTAEAFSAQQQVGALTGTLLLNKLDFIELSSFVRSQPISTALTFILRVFSLLYCSYVRSIFYHRSVQTTYWMAK
jgi:hypothetical protein